MWDIISSELPVPLNRPFPGGEFFEITRKSTCRF